jgi:mRNA-degrading endonuclease YafQ of YafQ-DinJ toxin-antitoxin module
MSADDRFRTLEFTTHFFQTLISRDFSDADRRRFLQAIERLDTDERHPSLRVHELEGKLRSIWSASASDQLRITFLLLEGGRKLLLYCTRHYQR